MLSFAKARDSQDQAKIIADTVIQETRKVFQSFQTEINDRFREIQSQLRQLDTSIEILERRLVSKDMQDRQQYGHLHYKLHEVKSTHIQDEIEGLKRELKLIHDQRWNNEDKEPA